MRKRLAVLAVLVLACSGCMLPVMTGAVHSRTVTWYIADDGTRSAVTEWHIEWPAGVVPPGWNPMTAVEPWVGAAPVAPEPEPELPKFAEMGG